ncbi:short-chain dehydrogenase/reductase [Patiriisocius marinistellae]|uniref:Short-chain dehydrogenase/reductase n=1 Tax=Patiriisocius marinistellae TaxID=2494560 RepID=A0A5J4G241_9FLAO|nr:SDR family oxidoreductase [Patiriisocius marinistellae]GEQ86615.1 short-chain dehydrogenase/reductase [Patiriisocius marinistellae]
MSKVVLITGGSSGIGKAIGEYLSEKGYTVYGTSRNPDRFKNDFPFNLVALDVTNTESIKNCILDVIALEGKIDVLINNAGVGITGPMEETPTIEIKKAFNTNLFGPIEMINATLPHMRKQKNGHIINITSIAGYMGLPYRGVYSATKGALELITEAYRMEVKQFGIQMANVAPGDFATNIAAGRYHAPVLEQSAYRQAYGDTLKMMDAHVDGGNDPNEMAKAVLSIIETTKPRVHYRVGAFVQKLSIGLKKVLPSKTYEKMLMKHYKL